MYVSIDGVKLFFDVEGASLAPCGPEMQTRPTLVLLHGGPGMDHSLFRPAFSREAEDIVAALPEGADRPQGAASSSMAINILRANPSPRWCAIAS